MGLVFQRAETKEDSAFFLLSRTKLFGYGCKQLSYDFFSRYQDAPYQVIVAVNYKENGINRDFHSEPSIQYYYIAAPTQNVPMPVLREYQDGFGRDEYDQIIKEIQESYLKQGRKVHKLTTTQTGFTFTTTSRWSGSDDPLSDYVYKSIKESLEEVFGSLN